MENNEEKKDNKVMKWSAKKNECNGIVICIPLYEKNGIKLAPPQGCEVDKVEVVDGVLTVTFKEKQIQFKAGDVLKCKLTGKLWLRLKDWENINSSVTTVCIGGGYILASKEERERFFKELEDNGYEFDLNKLELKNKERKLPKSFEEFCEMYPKCGNSFYIDDSSVIKEVMQSKDIRFLDEDKNILPDRATAEAVLALCQLIQLRNCYNGDWVPDWTDPTQDKFIIEICKNEIECSCVAISNAVLYFKTEELRDDFLHYFGDLIERLKPLYGIKEGGE